MIEPLEAALAVAGVAGGMVIVVWSNLSARVAQTLAVVLGGLILVVFITAMPSPLTAALTGVAVGGVILRLWWQQRPRPMLRSAAMFDVSTQRAIAAHELGVAGWWIGAGCVIALGLSVVAAGGSGVRWLQPAAVIVSIVAVRPVQPNPESDGVAVVPYPPVLFRGLVGWNLGLGLDAEQAAWAGQLARRSGLEHLLAQPEVAVGRVEAITLLTCRAMGAGSDVVRIELGSESLDASDMRRLSRLVAQTLGSRKLEVRAADPAVGRSFVERVESVT